MDIRTLLEEFLLEGKLEDLQRQHSDVSADTFNHYKSVVPNTTHLDWVLNQHKKGNITTEHDIDTIFTTFNRNKDSLPRKQISQYKSMDDLHSEIKPYIGHNLSVKDKAKDGTETVYSSPTMEIKQHSNYESCIKGSVLPSNNVNHDLTKEKGKAQWCISADSEDGEKEYKHYTHSGDFPVYSIEHKHEGGTTERHMLVANPFKSEAESELQDEQNLRPYATTKLKDGKRTSESTDPLLLSNYAHKHSELAKTPLADFFNPEKRNELQDKFVDKAIHEKNKSLISTIANSDNLHNRHIDTLINYGLANKPEHPYLLTNLSRSKNINNEQIDKLLQHGIESKDNNLLSVMTLSQRKLTPDHINTLINHGVSTRNVKLLKDILHRKNNFIRGHNISPEDETRIKSHLPVER